MILPTSGRKVKKRNINSKMRFKDSLLIYRLLRISQNGTINETNWPNLSKLIWQHIQKVFLMPTKLV